MSDAPINDIRERVRKQTDNGSADLAQYRLDRLEERIGILGTDVKTLLTDTATIKAKLDAIPTKEELANQLLSQQRWMIGALITVLLGTSTMIVHAVIRSLSS